MNGNHLDDSSLDAFVSGMGAPEEDAAVRAHVASCAGCADRLARFAAHEESIAAVAQARPAAAAPRAFAPRRSRRILWAGAALAAGIALAVFFSREPVQPDVAATVTEGIPEVICPDGPDQRGCIDEAQRRGLVIAYPALGGPLIGGAPLVVHEWTLE